MKSLAGKRAIVTGAASGIGRAIARELARQGCELELVDVDGEGLRRICDELGPAVLGSHVLDLADSDEVDVLAKRFVEEGGPIDLLINNAGILWFDPFETMPITEWDRLMRINLDAPARLIHGLLPAMRRRPGAHIVNISSILGLTPKRNMTAYCTSKYALVGFGLTLRTELSPEIGVSVVCPGLVKSNLYTSAKEQGRTSGRRKQPGYLSVSPDIVAKRVVRAIEKNKRLVVVTHHARATKLAHALAAWLLDRKQMKRNGARQRAAWGTSS
jgi:short-subunit dehydrogenase